jgi:hypothetical protein
MYKKYEDTVRAIQQVNLNNQTATSYNLSMTQDQTPAAARSIVSTSMSSVTPQLSAQRPQQLQQSIQQPQLQQQVQHHLQNRPRALFPQDYQQLAEIRSLQESLSQPNITPSMKQEFESRLHMLKATVTGKFQPPPGTTSLGTVSHMPPQSPRGFTNPQVVRSSIQTNMNTLNQNRTQTGKIYIIVN